MRAVFFALKTDGEPVTVPVTVYGEEYGHPDDYVARYSGELDADVGGVIIVSERVQSITFPFAGAAHFGQEGEGP